MAGDTAPVDTACWQPGTGATITLLVVFFWILATLSRPFRLWKGLLFAAMMTLAVLAFALPIGREFFTFDAHLDLIVQSLLIGLAGGLAIEAIHRWAPGVRDSRHVPD